MQNSELALHLALEIFAHVPVQLIPPKFCIAHVICEGELVVQVQTGRGGSGVTCCACTFTGRAAGVLTSHATDTQAP